MMSRNPRLSHEWLTAVRRSRQKESDWVAAAGCHSMGPPSPTTAGTFLRLRLGFTEQRTQRLRVGRTIAPNVVSDSCTVLQREATVLCLTMSLFVTSLCSIKTAKYKQDNAAGYPTDLVSRRQSLTMLRWSQPNRDAKYTWHIEKICDFRHISRYISIQHRAVVSK